jgi:hypothetical protein
MSSWYEELGAPPSADQDQLRRLYRQRARALHPDVNVDVDDDSAMQRLNAAWAVLGDPESRRRYDEHLRQQAGHPSLPPLTAPAEADSWTAPPSPPIGIRLLRPSVIIPMVLLFIFVVTAYAGHTGSTGRAPTPTPTTLPGQPTPTAASASGPALTVPASAFVGRCIQDQQGTVALVPCSVRPNSLVIATMPAAGTCPARTSAYLVAGQSEMVCAQPSGP